MSAEVSLNEFVEAISVGGADVIHYLNRKSGEIRELLREDFRIAEMDEDDDFELDESQREVAQAVREIVGSTDWLMLPDEDEVDEASVVEDFCRSYPDRRKREKLRRAFNGRGAFRRFKDVLIELEIETLWYRFRDEAFTKFAIEWLGERRIPFRNDLSRAR